QGRLRGLGDRVQRLEHPGGSAGSEPSDHRRAFRADPGLGGPPQAPRRGGDQAGEGSPPGRRGTPESFPAPAGCARTALRRPERFAPSGLYGGQSGALAKTVVNPGPQEHVIHGKASVDFGYGDVISFQQSGAGGYGPPFERDPARVFEDVLDGYVSVEQARTD